MVYDCNSSRASSVQTMSVKCVCVYLPQAQAQEDVQKERAQVEELKAAQSALEKERSRLGAELKSLGEKSDKVRM